MANATPEAPFGGPRPETFIVGVISDQQQSESAANVVRSSGFSEESINVFHGKSGADAIRHRGERGSNLIQRIWDRFDEFAMGATDDIQRHIDAADRGNYVVVVVLPNADGGPREVVRQIIKSHGGYDIVLVGLHSIELLDT